jgi:2,4'-dihydroxyacetophenone dioxygenase
VKLSSRRASLHEKPEEPIDRHHRCIEGNWHRCGRRISPFAKSIARRPLPHTAFSEEKMSTTISSEQGQVPECASIDESKIAYQRPQPFGMVPDAFVGSALDLVGDEREWVPQSPTVSFKPLILSVSQGFYINILRVRSSGVLSRHRHTGPVHAFTLRGKWRYLEHDWVATAGDYAFEPPGETHTLVVPDDVQEMATLFHVTGGYIYVDPFGVALGYEDVFTKLEHAVRHYDAVGLGKGHVSRIVR